MYLAKELFDQNDSWPGDFQGRDILALTSLYKAYEGYEDKQKDVLHQLEDIFAVLDSKVNCYGYFGKVFDGITVNEQQVSSNSWFLRGLVNYYKITGDEKYLAEIKSITEHFLLPLAPFYENYPVERERKEDGGVSGNVDGTILNGWEVSSDIGCAFIMLDGITAAYEVYREEPVKKLIERMIDKFLTIDYLSLECQTHATLSCTRGIIRYSKYNPKYLLDAIHIFDRYLKNGMTYDYANINWFQRFTTWTEPCGIIDSMIVARKLYEITGKEKYLDIFNRIYVNSLRTFQRDNGGAGCSTCAVKDSYLLKSFLYEAFFCCTMRLGDCTHYLTDFLFTEKEGIYSIPYPSCFHVTEAGLDVDIDSEFYYNGNRIRIEVGKLQHPITLRFRVPEKTAIEKNLLNKRWFSVTLKKEGVYTYPLEIDINEQNGIFFYGDILLTKKDEKMQDEILIGGRAYSYVYDNSCFDEHTLNEKPQYVK